MPAVRKSGEKRVFQLKVTLKVVRPPIWRRIQVHGDTNFEELHRILQAAMGWNGGHLHEFMVIGNSYGDLRTLPGEVLDQRKVTLEKLKLTEKQKFNYVYDFGDNWEHEILVEKLFRPEEGMSYPVCIKGKRACPPDDCGGPYGYQDLLEVLQDPSHTDYEEMREWVDDDFDPEHFDIDTINKILGHRSRGAK